MIKNPKHIADASWGSFTVIELQRRLGRSNHLQNW